MAGINKVFLLGNLGQDPDVRSTSGGSMVANMSLATGESWKDKETGDWKEKTEWHRVVMFGRLAEIADQYLKKGARVHIEGKVQTRKWQDRDGNDKYTTEIVAGSMIMLGEKDGQGRSHARPQSQPQHADEGQAARPSAAPSGTTRTTNDKQGEFVDDSIPF